MLWNRGMQFRQLVQLLLCILTNMLPWINNIVLF